MEGYLPYHETKIIRARIGGKEDVRLQSFPPFFRQTVFYPIRSCSLIKSIGHETLSAEQPGASFDPRISSKTILRRGGVQGFFGLKIRDLRFFLCSLVGFLEFYSQVRLWELLTKEPIGGNIRVTIGITERRMETTIMGYVGVALGLMVEQIFFSQK